MDSMGYLSFHGPQRKGTLLLVVRSLLRSTILPASRKFSGFSLSSLGPVVGEDLKCREQEVAFMTSSDFDLAQEKMRIDRGTKVFT